MLFQHCPSGFVGGADLVEKAFVEGDGGGAALPGDFRGAGGLEAVVDILELMGGRPMTPL